MENKENDNEKIHIEKNKIDSKNQEGELLKDNSVNFINLENNDKFNSINAHTIKKNKVNDIKISEILKEENEKTKNEKNPYEQNSNIINVIKKDEENEYETRIGICTEDLLKLKKEDLLDLILFIKYSCSMILEDHRYVDSGYNIFSIVKSKDKKGFDIIIDNNKINKLKNRQINLNDTSNGNIICKECGLIFGNMEYLNDHYTSLHTKNGNEKEKKHKIDKAQLKHKQIEIKFNKWKEDRMNQNENEVSTDKNKKLHKIEIIEDKNEINKKEKKDNIKTEKSNQKSENEKKSKNEKVNDDINKVINEMLNENEIYKFSCEFCLKKFISKYALDNHKKDKNHIQLFFCKVCDKQFQSENAKESHCKSKNHNENIFCNFCGKYFTSEEAKEQHCKSKKHDKEFYCNICKKFFSSVESKEQHCKAKNH